jgi:hypothetical protein
MAWCTPASAIAASRGARDTLRFTGVIHRAELYRATVRAGLEFRLTPMNGESDGAWAIGVWPRDSVVLDYAAVATPPYRGVNPRYVEGWHFRNRENTGPGRGDMNAPGEERAFQFVECRADFDSCHAARAHFVARQEVSAVLPGLATFALLLAAGVSAGPRPYIAMDDASWHLESSSDGIALFRGSVPGIGIVPLKAVMTIPGTIEEVSMVLEDLSRRGEWISNFGQSVLLERTNDYDQTEYLRVNVPWPAQDRSALVRARVTVSDDLRRATIAAESVDSHPADTLPTLVRSKVYASTFQMTQWADHVEVVALVFIDPCGSIPKWIVNYFTRRVARATLSGLRRQVARKLYAPTQLVEMRRRMQAFRAFRQQHLVAP